jgi:hypothetical protein
MKKGFFAYSSEPKYCEDVIEDAIKQINDGGVAHITSWKSLRVNGKFIINEVLEAIEEADFFAQTLLELMIMFSLKLVMPLELIGRFG